MLRSPEALLSLAEMVDAGHDVHFMKSGSYAEHRDTKKRTPIIRRRGKFELDLEVLPYNGKQEVSHVDKAKPDAIKEIEKRCCPNGWHLVKRAVAPAVVTMAQLYHSKKSMTINA